MSPKSDPSPVPPTSEARHTPGPWIISCREQDDEILDENRYFIRLQPYPDGHVGKLVGTVNKHLQESESNARLIAAAPALLSAAEAALVELKTYQADCGEFEAPEHVDALDRVVVQVAAAIAAARGGVA